MASKIHFIVRAAVKSGICRCRYSIVTLYCRENSYDKPLKTNVMGFREFDFQCQLDTFVYDLLVTVSFMSSDLGKSVRLSSC